MKNMLLLFALLACSGSLFAQGNIGINDPNPDPLAILDIESTTKGVLIPRMTEAQRSAIAVTAAQNGLLVYQTDGSSGFWFYDGAAWEKMGAGSGRVVDWGFNSDYGTDPSSDFTFLGPVAEVTVTANTQIILVTANRAFGSTDAAGADDLDICIGFAPVATPETVSGVGGCSYDLRVSSNTRVIFGLSGIIEGLAPGNYLVGLVGDCDSDPTKWNSNEYGYVTALVID